MVFVIFVLHYKVHKKVTHSYLKPTQINRLKYFSLFLLTPEQKER